MSKNRPGNRAEFECRDAVDNRSICHDPERGVLDGVAKDFLRPYRRGLWHRQVDGNKTEIAALLWPKHQAVRPEAHLPPITVGGFVLDPECDQPKISHCRVKPRARTDCHSVQRSKWGHSPLIPSRIK